MRAVLVDWLGEGQVQVKLLQETLFSTISIVDRFLAVEGPLLCVQMPHHHELHEDLPQGPQPWQGYRRDQEAVGGHRRQGRAWSEGHCRSDPSSRVTTFRLSPLEQT